ncbi:DUF3048 domain-containing protein [Nocardioides solisilvae]|uniref:DUF3048 domain-containing protein n=1 Tax=Nocardioides solisilvae TaxID=1542435 RepID=UPI0013A54015|nr:DUF3048 domain-containing protein [Nocardioides solisilvae]
MRRPLALTAALLSLSLLLAGCSGGDGDDAAPTATEPSASESAPPEPAAPETWPLTGLEAAEGRTTAARHPVMVTKIDNTASAAPQLGLGKADLVVEELVEGGTTRLAAFFYSQLPEVVGPVRSMRASDIGIVTPVEADVITSGAAQVTKNRINGAGITFFEEGARGFFRESSRYAPYNLMARPREVATAAKQEAARPADYFTFGDPAALPKGRKASTLSADFGRHTTTWQFADGAYRNVGGYMGADDQFVPDTVLVLRVRVGDAGYRDPAGSFVPETIFEGQGPALLFHGGRVVKATWSKRSLGAQLVLRGKGGEIAVPPGRTWVELVPQDAHGGAVTHSR